MPDPGHPRTGTNVSIFSLVYDNYVKTLFNILIIK